MRKDLKIGMAIGAVLLVVVIVYFAMPKPDGTTELTDAGGAVIDGVNEPVAAVDPDASTPEQAVPTDQDDATERPAGGPSGAVAANGTPPGSTDPFDVNAQAPDSDVADSTAPPDGEGTNWAKLLDTGEFAPPLRTVTPNAADRGAVGAITGGTPAVTDTGAGGNSADAATTGTPPVGGPTVSGTTPTSPIEREPVEADAAAGPAGDTASAARVPTERDRAGNVRKHVMKKGETYTSIAKLMYGDGRHYLDIQKANPDLDPARIRPGTEINLPDPASIKRANSGNVGAEPAGPTGNAGAGIAAAEPRALDPKTEYEVKSNDSLHKIATSVYGTSTMWEKIYELNQQAIGSDPAKLKLGMVLKLPPNPSEAQRSDAATTSGETTESASR